MGDQESVSADIQDAGAGIFIRREKNYEGLRGKNKCS